VTVEFSAPFNWCDGECQRCPLLEGCPSGKQNRARRWAHEMRGRDPDDARVAMEDVRQDLERTESLLEEIASRQGISLDDLPKQDRSVVSLDLVRLRQAAMASAVATQALVASIDALHPALAGTASRVRGRMILLPMKVYRLCSHAEDRVEDTWLSDALPNLLLVERVLAEIVDALGEVERSFSGEETSRAKRAYDDLARLLQPWISGIPRDVRSAVQGMIAEGRAPSPFCTVAPRTE